MITLDIALMAPESIVVKVFATPNRFIIFARG